MAFYAVSRLPGKRMASSLALIFVPVGALTILAMPSVIGQYYFNRGSLARAAGNNEQAIANYRKAMSWDNFYTTGIEVYNVIGQLERQAGLDEGSAERAISRAVDLRSEGQYEPAILELQRVAETNPALAKTVRHEALRIRADWGLACYQSGAIDAAVTNWQQALAEDSKGRSIKSQPALLYVLPYLARGNYISAATRPDSRRRRNGLRSRPIMAHSRPPVTGWAQIAMQSWVVPPKLAITIPCLGRELESDE